MLAVWAGSSVLPTDPAHAREIGVTAAVRPDVHGTPPQQETRILHVGADLNENERVDTSGVGQTHLLFRDGSTLSIGPGATVVLDKFVYDPDSKTGELVVSASKGVLRFVGGRISKTRPVLIKTPTAVIGVRGGVAMMTIADPQQQQQNPGTPPASVTMLYGDEVFMDNGDSRQTMRRPGFTMSQTPEGGFTPPTPVTQQQLNQQLGTLEDPPPPEEGDGQGLGDIAPAAGGGVSDSDVAQTQLSALGSSNNPSEVSNEPQTAPPANTSTGQSDSTTENASQNLATTSTGDTPGGGSNNSPPADTGSPSDPGSPADPGNVSAFPVTQPLDADPNENSVSESAAVGAAVGVSAEANDPDSFDSVTYSLSDDANGRFAIDPVTGVITVLDPGLLDIETATSHTVTVLVTSSDQTSETNTFTITLLDDVTEFDPTPITDTDAATETVLDTASNGSPVGFTALSTDADLTDTITYLLVNDAGGRFTIDPDTGVVSVADASQINYKSNRSHVIQPRADSLSGSGFLPGTTTTIDVAYDGFVGRFKRDNGDASGTKDGVAGEDIGLANILLVGNRLTASPSEGNFNLPIPLPNGTASLSGSDTLPFPCCTTVANSVFLTNDQQFAFYEITETGGERDILFAGDPTTNFPTSGSLGYQLLGDFPRASDLGLIEFASAPSGNGKAFIRWEASSPTAQLPFGGGVIYISGQGSAQTSGAFFMSGRILSDDGVDPHVSGSFFGTSDPANSTNVSSFYYGPLASSDAGDGSDFFGINVPNYFVLEAADVDTQDDVSSYGATKENGGLFSDYNPNVLVSRDNSATFNNSRTGNTWEGFAAGLEVQTDGSGSITGVDILKTASDQPGNIVLSRDPTENTMNAVFLMEETEGGSRSLDIRFGTGSADGSGAFIDDKRFYAAGTTAAVDGNFVDSQHGLATSDVFVYDSFLPTGVSICSCEFVTWGFWGANRQLEDSSASRAHTHLGTWVAGATSLTSQLVGIAPQSATYTGHVIAGIDIGTDTYQAIGKMELQFTFGAGNYTLDSVAVTNLDNTNYSSSAPGADFGGSVYSSTGAEMSITGIHPTAGSVSMKLQGTFFGNGTPPQETAGQVQITNDGNTYVGAGTYAAARP